MVWSWESDPFAATPPNQNPSGLGTFVFNLRLPGQYFDGETGVNQNYFRDYDPAVGRYLESDPVGLGGGSSSTYSYASGNPVSNMDPSGLSCVAVGSTVTCSYPGGPTVQFPRPDGWPALIAQGMRYYHRYDQPIATNCPAKLMAQGIARSPTPGFPSPASSAGTLNDATPDTLRGATGMGGFMDMNVNYSPVLSYLTSDVNTGMPVVLNVTLPGHPLFPGYVARVVQPTAGGSIVHNYGEGSGWPQSTKDPAAPMINGVWDLQTRQIAAGLACGCGQ